MIIFSFTQVFGMGGNLVLRLGGTVGAKRQKKFSSSPQNFDFGGDE
jgi:hypothetical protein